MKDMVVEVTEEDYDEDDPEIYLGDRKEFIFTVSFDIFIDCAENIFEASELAFNYLQDLFMNRTPQEVIVQADIVVEEHDITIEEVEKKP